MGPGSSRDRLLEQRWKEEEELVVKPRDAEHKDDLEAIGVARPGENAELCGRFLKSTLEVMLKSVVMQPQV